MNTIAEKNKEYREYILDHMNNVIESYHKYKNLLFDVLDVNISKRTMDLMIDTHDVSKFSSDEFNIYRRYYFPSDEDEKKCSEYEFNLAWLNHIHRNPHHPQYWIFYNDEKNSVDVYEIPDEYIVEMICDWLAMSIKFNNTIYDWYDANKDSLFIHPNTRNKIEKIINSIKEYNEEAKSKN